MADHVESTDVTQARRHRSGLLLGVVTYAFWGLAPIYFRELKTVNPFEVLCHRIVGSVILLLILMRALGLWSTALQSLRRRGTLPALCASAVLISANWVGYIYAVGSGQTLQGSLGYYINPLLNVLLAVLFLRERLRPVQIVAVLIAAAGVVVLTVHGGQFPWLALTLAFSFGLYGLTRKLVPVNAVTGLTVETLLLFPFALAGMLYLLVRGEGAFLHQSRHVDTMLLLAGVITAAPLLSFAGAARRLRFSTLGLLQYISPTGQFLVAVLLFREPFLTAHAICFGLIWTALALFAWDSFRARQ